LAQYIRGAGISPEDAEKFVQRLEDDEYYRLYILMLVLRRKAHDLLTAIAKGEDVPEPGEHPVEEAPEEPEEEAEESDEIDEAESEDAEAEIVEEEETIVVAEDAEGDVVEEDVVEEETEEADEASE